MTSIKIPSRQTKIHKRGIVYCLHCECCDEKYIGSTTSKLKQRFSRHKTSAKHGSQYNVHKHIRYHGMDNISIKRVKGYKSITLTKLSEKEQIFSNKYTRQGHTLLNTNSITTGIAVSQTYDQLAYTKEYNKNNRLSINTKARASVLCDCGVTFTYSNRFNHCKTKVHQEYISQ